MIIVHSDNERFTRIEGRPFPDFSEATTGWFANNPVRVGKVAVGLVEGTTPAGNDTLYFEPPLPDDRMGSNVVRTLGIHLKQIGFGDTDVITAVPNVDKLDTSELDSAIQRGDDVL